MKINDEISNKEKNDAINFNKIMINTSNIIPPFKISKEMSNQIKKATPKCTLTPQNLKSPLREKFERNKKSKAHEAKKKLLVFSVSKQCVQSKETKINVPSQSSKGIIKKPKFKQLQVKPDFFYARTIFR